MRVEWYGHSAFRLAAGEAAVVIDPFGDLSPMAERGIGFDYPAIDGVEADFVFDLHGLRVSHFGDFGQRTLRDEQA